MNERIRELAKQADGVFIHKLITGAKQYTFLEKDLEKFAELIVRECMDLLEDYTTDINVGGIQYNVVGASETLQEHFGIEE